MAAARRLFPKSTFVGIPVKHPKLEVLDVRPRVVDTQKSILVLFVVFCFFSWLPLKSISINGVFEEHFCD